MEFIRRYQVARKKHVCDVCTYAIQPVEVYVRHTAPLSPGRHGWITIKSCGPTSMECNNYWVVDSKLLNSENVPI